MAVGHCGLWLKDFGEGRGTAGYSVAPSARGPGLAADALSALTIFGWTVPGLFRIELYIEPWNLGSIRTAERAGYLSEGLLRRQEMIGSERRDMLLYASLRHD
jgi:ribosomal-protein-alanine N-acetyltransferase